MSLQKNQIIPLQITALSNDGSGIGRCEGEAVFVPGTAPGDELRVRILKDCGRYAFGRVESIAVPSAARRAPDCAVAAPCGGCSFRHLDYAAELEAKRSFVTDAFARIGGFSLAAEAVLPSPQQDRYRNKVQFPVGQDAAGHLCIGFYAGRTHRIVPCSDCLLQPEELNRIAAFLCRACEARGVTAYSEESGKGMLRHIFLRRGAHSGEILLCLVCTQRSLPRQDTLVQEVTAAFPAVRTVVLNVNRQRTNVILGGENLTLYGPGTIGDTLCGVPIRLGPMSFYQVNTPAAEQLYAVAAAFAALRPQDRLLDLYCGMGTIGLSMAGSCAELIGAEIVPEAIAAARASAAQMAAPAAQQARFLCADAGAAAQQLLAEGLRPDVVMLDPPRRGCDEATLDAVLQMAPQRIVMVSCNPATAARDAKYLAARGYAPQRLQPVDLFPRTNHVELVCLLEKQAAALNG